MAAPTFPLMELTRRVGRVNSPMLSLQRCARSSVTHIPVASRLESINFLLVDQMGGPLIAIFLAMRPQTHFLHKNVELVLVIMVARFTSRVRLIIVLVRLVERVDFMFTSP
jgi:hypothetical protein